MRHNKILGLGAPAHKDILQSGKSGSAEAAVTPWEEGLAFGERLKALSSLFLPPTARPEPAGTCSKHPPLCSGAGLR